MFTPPSVSCVTCHVSHVTCHVSRITCHMSHVTCHMSHVTCHFFLFFRPSGEAYWWRVCYQRGLPRLVYKGEYIVTYFFSQQFSVASQSPPVFPQLSLPQMRRPSQSSSFLQSPSLILHRRLMSFWQQPWPPLV